MKILGQVGRVLNVCNQGFGDYFVLVWEKKNLTKISGSLNSFRNATGNDTAQSTSMMGDAFNLLKTYTQKMLVYPALLSSTVLQEASVVDSPWALIRDKAEKAGVLLAHELIEGKLGARPATLIGVSMGARVIFYCLEELAKISQGTEVNSDNEGFRDALSVVEHVILIGAAVPADLRRWASVRAVVSGRLINCYNPKDDVLSVIYRTVHWMHDGIYPAAGVSPVSSLPQTNLVIENIDISDDAKTHMDYQEESNLRTILEKIQTIFIDG